MENVASLVFTSFFFIFHPGDLDFYPRWLMYRSHQDNIQTKFHGNWMDSVYSILKLYVDGWQMTDRPGSQELTYEQLVLKWANKNRGARWLSIICLSQKVHLFQKVTTAARQFQKIIFNSSRNNAPHEIYKVQG